jgi:hypothetical protein
MRDADADPGDAARPLACEACLNVRDVGGYPSLDGVRTVIDLRHGPEMAGEAHPFGPRGAHAATPGGTPSPWRPELPGRLLALRCLLCGGVYEWDYFASALWRGAGCRADERAVPPGKDGWGQVLPSRARE